LRKTEVIRLISIALIIAAVSSAVACAPAGTVSLDAPAISSLTPEHPDVYPVGNTRITCVAASKDGSALTYQWVCNDGTITGSGATVTWEAPKTYGDFHIMCTVYDAAGHKSSQTTTVTVLVRDPSKCCR